MTDQVEIEQHPDIADTSLLERYVREGDSDAFNELVRRYSGLVYGTCYRVTGNRDDAQDVSQECFLELARHTPNIKCSLPGWLHRVAHNRSANIIRNASTQRRYEYEAVTLNSASDHQLPSDLAEHVDSAVEGLPEQLRIPIVLYYFRGYTQQEIARELELNQATVSRLLDRGIAQLRRQLEVVIPVAIFAVIFSKTVAYSAPESVITALQRTTIPKALPIPKTFPLLNKIWSTLAGKLAIVTSLIVTSLFVGHQMHVSRNGPVLKVNPVMKPVAALLVDQESKCGGSLEIRYASTWHRYVGGQEAESMVSECHYIRTPEACRIEKQRTDSTVVESYDRRANEFRILSQSSMGGGGGAIGNGKGDSLMMREMFETVRYPLHTTFLCDGLQYGIVARRSENVDGYSCIRIEIPSGRPNLPKYIVWLDPKIGYTPRKIEFARKGTPSDVIVYEGYKEIGNGVWFPIKQTVTYASQISGETFKVENIVTGVVTGQNFTNSDVIVKFPPNIMVKRL